MKPVRLAIVDDAAFIRSALVRLLKNTPISVVGTARSGEELLAHLDEWRPDVITLDLNMPGMGGLATLDRIMQTRATPVIILSTHSGEGAPLTLEALSRGAADFIDKEAYSLVDFQALRQVLVARILALTRGAQNKSDVQPSVRRGEQQHGSMRQPFSSGEQPLSSRKQPLSPTKQRRYDLAVIGASTGGPRAVEHLLRQLGPAGVPVAIVQHMPKRFTRAFADRLDGMLPCPVREAGNGDVMRPDTVYIARGDEHMRVIVDGDAMKVRLSDSPESTSHRPSVDVLFESVAECAANRTVAVLLTGMGRDGAQGMLSLYRKGAHTIVQDQESCVVYGMPRAAVEAGATQEVIPLNGIAPRMRNLLDRTV